MNKTTSVEDHKLTAAYESLRKQLSAAKYADRIDKPLAYWALRGDRRLPMALLSVPLKQLLSRSFEELAATPGIGNRKLHSLIKLLQRATKDQPPAVPLVADEPAQKRKGGRVSRSERAGFDPAIISEGRWEQWRETVRRYGLVEEMLGRLAPSLERLPTVIWRKPLADYLDSTVAEIRNRKTHGEKRTRAILEVFYSIHEILAHVPREGHLRFDVRPKFTKPIQQWIEDALLRSQTPTSAELKQRIIVPIVEQLRIDAGPMVHRLVEERLGIKSSPHRVLHQAKRLGVTRARVYQLLETCGDVMAIRWPEGEELFLALYQKLVSFPGATAQTEQLGALIDLIYPDLDYRRAPPADRLTMKPQGKQAAAGGGNHRRHRDPKSDGRKTDAERMASARQ